MKTINSFEHLARLTKSHQVTAQELLNGQTLLDGKGWSSIRLRPKFKEELILLLSNMYGGHQKTRDAIYRNLKLENRQCWGLDRTVTYNRRGKYGMQYITGQDQTYENRAIRKELS